MINKNLLLPGSPAIGFNSTHGKFVFVFFPTGSEFDLIGFLMLEEEETKKGGRVNVVGNSSNVVFIANKRLNQRIRGILVNHAAEDSNWLIAACIRDSTQADGSADRDREEHSTELSVLTINLIAGEPGRSRVLFIVNGRQKKGAN
ncbi:hypothetical protein LINPERPRIM_LOCUS325 [Linum perenne]